MLALDSVNGFTDEQIEQAMLADPARTQAILWQLRERDVGHARADVNMFCEFVGRDESTSHPLKQASIHLAFQKLATECPRLVLWSHIEAGKSSQLAVLRPLWELGRNRGLRVAIISRGQDQARKIISAQQNYIERSPELRAVFPELRRGTKWSETAYSVARSGFAKDYSVQALGIGSIVIGARLDLVVLDDVLDWNNTRSPTARGDVREWYRNQIAPRLTADARVWCVGNAWHPDDFLHALAKTPGWTAVRFPVFGDDGAPRWPERWPRERVNAWTRENGTDVAARMLHCVARDDESSRFRRAWIDKCLENGAGRSMPFSLKMIPFGYRTFTGVDLATDDDRRLAKTVIFTICVHPDQRREVLCVESGRWPGPEIVKRIADAHKRYQSIVAVEGNAAQRFISQFTAVLGIPVRNFFTGANKAHPEFGVESIAVEMEQGRWIIPSAGGRPLTREVDDWISGMLYYRGDAHTSDELMACWIAREAASHRVKRVGRGHQSVQSR
jgi:hypothetical protein